mmetsp:Transcript_13471/g.29539  ORF Transcript_13471/g.29539 Transcript_13471/m.29539 type:complete len:123 (-) Transcript_13471:961-1329(-)
MTAVFDKGVGPGACFFAGVAAAWPLVEAAATAIGGLWAAVLPTLASAASASAEVDLANVVEEELSPRAKGGRGLRVDNGTSCMVLVEVFPTERAVAGIRVLPMRELLTSSCELSEIRDSEFS